MPVKKEKQSESEDGFSFAVLGLMQSELPGSCKVTIDLACAGEAPYS